MFQIKHSKDINDMLNFNIKTLSEQVSELYAEVIPSLYACIEFKTIYCLKSDLIKKQMFLI